ncbi:MAG: WcaF family extracellular polysaccharide biosynthesis acetyltransferase [Bacteroidota bacterium]
MNKTDLSSYDNSDFDFGASRFKWALWFIVNVLVVRNTLNPLMGIKRFVLRLFGARIGRGVVIKPGVNIKFPWRLHIEDHAWIGENVWIDNLAQVTIGSHVCLSQGAMLITGNHNYKKSTFDLMVGEITLEEGVWIGAGAVVTANVRCGSHAILTSGSMTSKDLEAYMIYSGVPAQKIRERVIE